ncbi:hypothetical protein [Lusitaniella coriacea]
MVVAVINQTPYGIADFYCSARSQQLNRGEGVDGETAIARQGMR